MAIGSRVAWDDSILPFQLDNADIRGRMARLDGTLDQILSQHDYPADIEALVAETALLTALIGQAIKLRWKLSLQVRSKGPARLIATDYYGPDNEGGAARIRAYASFDRDRLVPVENPFDLIGEGYLAVMIDQGQGITPYQGFTPIAGRSLADCTRAYFLHSEQIPTTFSLAYGKEAESGQDRGWRAGGMMLQHMPPAGRPAPGTEGAPSQDHVDILSGQVDESWSRAGFLLDTVQPEELVGPQVSPTDLLIRLFHEEAPRVFDAQPVRFGCSCSEEKVRSTMSIYSQKDIARMTTAQGVVTADCQFCSAHYELDPKTLGFEARDDD